MQQLLYLIDLIETESVQDIRLFIWKHPEYFSGIPFRSLLPAKITHTETDYIFLIGSYLYVTMTGKPVTWLERRRFANYGFSDQYNQFFQKTLSNHAEDRIQTLTELKDFLAMSDFSA